MKMRTCHWIFGISCVLAGALLAAVWGLREIGGILLWFPFGSTREVVHLLSFVLYCLVPSWLAICLWRRAKTGWSRTVIGILLALVLLSVSACHGISYGMASAATYEVFTSPDGKQTVVLEKQSYFHTQSCTVYELTSPVTLRILGSGQWEFGGAYTVTWEGDHVLVENGGKKRYYHLWED